MMEAGLTMCRCFPRTDGSKRKVQLRRCSEEMIPGTPFSQIFSPFFPSFFFRVGLWDSSGMGSGRIVDREKVRLQNWDINFWGLGFHEFDRDLGVSLIGVLVWFGSNGEFRV